MFIGLMGIDNDGALIMPSGKKLFKVPFVFACLIQKIQHWIAQKTWKQIK